MAQIHHHIEGATAADAHEFSLRCVPLKVDPAQHPSSRDGVVVLNPRPLQAERSESIGVEGFEEAPSLIPENRRRQHQHLATERSLNQPHRVEPFGHRNAARDVSEDSTSQQAPHKVLREHA